MRNRARRAGALERDEEKDSRARTRRVMYIDRIFVFARRSRGTSNATDRSSKSPRAFSPSTSSPSSPHRLERLRGSGASRSTSPGSDATATRGDFDDFAIAVVHLTLAVAFAVTRRGVVRP